MLKFFEGKNVAITDRVLILGESHYPASKEEYKKEIQDNVTSIVMEQFFNNVDNDPFFTRIALSFSFDNHDEAVEFFDDELAKGGQFKQLVTDFVKYRHDAISSDREAAAFVFACDKLGYI
jgi:hypothetical protein